MDTYEIANLRPAERYLEFLRVPALSAGVYVLRAGETDPQEPHREDEIYCVTSGRGMIRVGAEDRPVQSGSIVYVPPGVEHRFHSITQDLRVLVVFAPAETSPT
jgi:mannose-6-phosphate isomerase-like protein (cupin superfamily)